MEEIMSGSHFPGSTRVSRVGEGVLAIANFSERAKSVASHESFERLFRRDAETNTRDACATQQIIVRRLFHPPHRRTPIFSETIKRSEFRQGAQFVFRKRRRPPFEIVQRLELPIFALPHEFLGVFLSQSVHHAKPQTHCVVIDNRTTPIGLRNANRFDLQPMSLRVFHNRCRGVKAHRLIIEQTRVKLRRPMHF
jgi:hypothetical protein